MKQIYWPILGYVILMTLVAWFEVDWQLAAFWFDMEGQQWAFRHHWFFQGILHDTAHDIVVAAYVLILLTFIASYFVKSLEYYRFGLKYLTISLPVATLSVSFIKRLTHIDCPWSVIDFAGVRDYQFWLSSIGSPIEGAGHCFPAAHASSAYMLFGLYFVTRHYWPKYSKLVLASVILLGIVFGVAQQLRGAHFLSHDLTSALVCWCMNYLIWQYGFAKQGSRLAVA